MKRVSIQINDGSHINVSADRMEIQGERISACDGRCTEPGQSTSHIGWTFRNRRRRKRNNHGFVHKYNEPHPSVLTAETVLGTPLFLYDSP